MKKGLILMGILAMVLVFGMTVVGCSDDDDAIDAKYQGTYTRTTGTTYIYEYSYIVSDAKVEYLTKYDGNVITNYVYNEVWTDGAVLWCKENDYTHTRIGTFDSTGLKVGSNVYTKTK
ncbi:MAG: hypothetical protein LBH44_12200 [Treponema sp.]|jgi:hypothetical protein|nr:hypothetical protein [Treponema sp.]